MNENRYASVPERWQAILDRDRRADGAFVYGVVTTGVYCRPHCASRRPNRGNVRFFDSWEAAEKASFRACKRCAPNAAPAPDQARAAVVRACALMDEAERTPSLKELADAAGLSPSHFQRLFTKTVGVSPKQYAMQKRLGRVRDSLRSEATVAAAVHAAGFESGSRFYEDAADSLGMTPSQYRQGGEGAAVSYAIARTGLGLALIAATDLGVCRVDFGESPEELLNRLRDAFPKARLRSGDPAFEERVGLALRCLEEPRCARELPLDIRGTAFQRQVWAALRDIPPGATATYSGIARQIGRPAAVRAVASACAANAIAVIIPCHRVIRSDGGLGGYRWGLGRKQALLERETQEESSNMAADGAERQNA